MSMISVTILTKNSAKYLKRVLQSVQNFDDVIVYDTGSVDSTFSIAQQFPNVTFVKGPFEGFGITHNKASEVAKNDWIFDFIRLMVAEYVYIFFDFLTIHSYVRLSWKHRTSLLPASSNSIL